MATNESKMVSRQKKNKNGSSSLPPFQDLPHSPQLFAKLATIVCIWFLGPETRSKYLLMEPCWEVTADTDWESTNSTKPGNKVNFVNLDGNLFAVTYQEQLNQKQQQKQHQSRSPTSSMEKRENFIVEALEE